MAETLPAEGRCESNENRRYTPLLSVLSVELDRGEKRGSQSFATAETKSSNGSLNVAAT